MLNILCTCIANNSTHSYRRREAAITTFKQYYVAGYRFQLAHLFGSVHSEETRCFFLMQTQKLVADLFRCLILRMDCSQRERRRSWDCREFVRGSGKWIKVENDFAFFQQCWAILLCAICTVHIDGCSSNDELNLPRVCVCECVFAYSRLDPSRHASRRKEYHPGTRKSQRWLFFSV
jgi:hypothetical protein